MNTFGTQVPITIFGESHGSTIGIVIAGLEAGISLDLDLIRFELSKRRPKSTLSTPRVETDEFTIVSGVLGSVTTGAALTILVPNTNTRSEDYQATAFIPRPGHADYPAYVKYHGFHDKRGGGIFSGRITVLLTIAGAIAKQILNAKGIVVASHILSIHGVNDQALPTVHCPVDVLKHLETLDFPVLDPAAGERMKAEILAAKNNHDSVGGIVETVVVGVPAGVGEPFFNSVESHLSHLLFSIPALKGVAFGDGFDFALQTGIESSDGYHIEAGKVSTIANHNGGVLGGISTGMPLCIRTVFKPTSSIASPQSSIRLDDQTNTTLAVEGRHDPAIINRAVHVVNSVVYLGLFDLLVSAHSKAWMTSR
jgi:chorismate synthase